MTNLIITSSFVVVVYSWALFLVFQVSIKGWKCNFSFKSWKLVFNEKKHKWSSFSIFIPNFTVWCMQTIIITINVFLQLNWLFQKFKKIITNVVFFGKFVLKVLPTKKKKKTDVSKCFSPQYCKSSCTFSWLYHVCVRYYVYSTCATSTS